MLSPSYPPFPSSSILNNSIFQVSDLSLSSSHSIFLLCPLFFILPIFFLFSIPSSSSLLCHPSFFLFHLTFFFFHLLSSSFSFFSILFTLHLSMLFFCAFLLFTPLSSRFLHFHPTLSFSQPAFFFHFHLLPSSFFHHPFHSLPSFSLHLSSTLHPFSLSSYSHVGQRILILPGTSGLGMSTRAVMAWV